MIGRSDGQNNAGQKATKSRVAGSQERRKRSATIDKKGALGRYHSVNDIDPVSLALYTNRDHMVIYRKFAIITQMTATIMPVRKYLKNLSLFFMVAINRTYPISNRIRARTAG